MNKVIGAILLTLISISIFKLQQLYDASKYQLMMLNDFNITQNFQRPLYQIEQIPDEFPNLGVTTLPIKATKAIYYLSQDSLKKAKELLLKSLDDNPFLGMSETKLSEVYFEENKLDSAEYFARKALKINYRNVRHLLNIQRTLSKSQKFKELDSILDFYKVKLYNQEALEMFYQNHLVVLVSYKDKFSSNDSLTSQFALKQFKNNVVIKNVNQIISFGRDKISLVNDIDSQARLFFNDKQYEKAVKKWKEAIQIKEDAAYYLNLIQCLIILDDFEQLERLFNEFENKNLNKHTGKYEYLKGLFYQKKSEIKNACENFKKSYQKGYKTSKSLLDYNKCS